MTWRYVLSGLAPYKVLKRLRAALKDPEAWEAPAFYVQGGEATQYWRYTCTARFEHSYGLSQLRAHFDQEFPAGVRFYSWKLTPCLVRPPRIRTQWVYVYGKGQPDLTKLSLYSAVLRSTRLFESWECLIDFSDLDRLDWWKGFWRVHKAEDIPESLRKTVPESILRSLF